MKCTITLRLIIVNQLKIQNIIKIIFKEAMMELLADFSHRNNGTQNHNVTSFKVLKKIMVNLGIYTQ